MGYWDKKSEQVVKETEKSEMSLDEFEIMTAEKIEEDGEYLSRKMQEHKERFERLRFAYSHNRSLKSNLGGTAGV